jgi:hypothetical protein
LRLKVYHQIELDALLDRKISRLLTLENSSGINPYLPKWIQRGSAVTYQTTEVNKHAE